MCRTLQQRFSKTIIWNEVLAERDLLYRAHKEGALDRVNLSLSREGGLTKVAETRDLCQQLFVPMIFAEPQGGLVTNLALAHLAQSTPPRFRRNILDTAGLAQIWTQISARSGLGFEPSDVELGEPKAIFT